MEETQYSRVMQPQNLGTLDRRVILTGAGFSRNWGGYLVNEMWGAILSEPVVQKKKNVRDLLLREMNFEHALTEVHNTTGYDEFARNALTAATHLAFVTQDENQCHELASNQFDSWNRCTGNLMGALIGKNNHHADWTSFYFTVNQDVLFERGFVNPRPELPNMPGVSSPAGFWKVSPDTRREFLPYDSVKHRVDSSDHE